MRSNSGYSGYFKKFDRKHFFIQLFKKDYFEYCNASKSLRWNHIDKIKLKIKRGKNILHTVSTQKLA